MCLNADIALPPIHKCAMIHRFEWYIIYVYMNCTWKIRGRCASIAHSDIIFYLQIRCKCDEVEELNDYSLLAEYPNLLLRSRSTFLWRTTIISLCIVRVAKTSTHNITTYEDGGAQSAAKILQVWSIFLITFCRLQKSLSALCRCSVINAALGLGTVDATIALPHVTHSEMVVCLSVYSYKPKILTFFNHTKRCYPPPWIWAHAFMIKMCGNEIRMLVSIEDIIHTYIFYKYMKFIYS